MNRLASAVLAALALSSASQGLLAQERIATNNTYNEFPRWTALTNAFNVEDGSGNRVLPSNLSMAQDFRNVLHIAGTLPVSGGGNQVFYLNNDWLGRRANGFSAPAQVSSLSSGASATDVEIVTLSDGQVIVIWVQAAGNEIRYRVRSASGSWGSITTGITGASGDAFSNLRTASRGTSAHLLFVRTNGASTKLEWANPTSSWSTTVISDSASTSSAAAGGNLAVDGSGNLFFVYEDYPSGGGQNAVYRQKPSGSSVSSATTIAADGYSPDVAVDSSGNVHIVYVKGSGANSGKVYHRVGSGGSDTHVGNTTAVTAAFDRVRIAVDSRNRPNVVWNTTADAGYAVKVGSTWTRQEPIQEPGRSNTGAGRGTNSWSFGPLDIVINPFDSVTWIDGTNALVSGMYEPNLGSQDSAAEFHMGPGCTVNGATGNLEFRLPLFSTKGVGFATSFTLIHNSLEAAWGTLSNGWSHNYHTYIEDAATGLDNNQDSLTVVFPDGSKAIFRYSSTYGYHVADSEYGVFSQLQRISASSSTNWVHSEYLLTTKFGVTYLFRADGKLVNVSDTNGNTIAFTYTGDAGHSADSTHPEGSLKEISDSVGRVTKLAYNSDGQLAYVRDPGSTTDNYSITYGSDKRVDSVSFLGVSGITWTFTYHTTNHVSNGYRIGMLNLVRTPRGTAATSQYGSTYRWYQDNRFASVTDPTVTIITSCSSDASPTSDAPVHGIEYTDPTTFVAPNYGTPPNSVPRVSHVDPCGRTTDIEYQSRKAIVDNKTDALGNTIFYTHDTYRNVTQVKDRRGYVTKYGYEVSSTPAHVKDNLVTVERPNDSGMGWLSPIYYAYTSDGFNRVSGYTDAKGNTTSYSYDLYGNLDGISYPLVTLVNGSTQTASESGTYTTGGRLETWTDARGGVTTYSYDDATTGLVTKIQEDGQSSGNADGYEYYSTGHLKKFYSSPNNLSTRVTEWVRDGLYRVTTVKDELANETDYVYDKNSNVIEVTNRREVATSFVYDNRDQLITIDPPSPAGSTNYTYDREGRLRRTTNGRGFTTVRLYDELGRLSELRRPGEGTDEGGGVDMVTRFEYDPNGNLTDFISDGTTDRETVYEYDPRNNLKRIDYPVGSLEDQFLYDANDNLVAINRVDGTNFRSGKLLNYDTRSRVIRRYELLSTYTSGTPTAPSTKYLHDENGNVVQVWNANATTYGTANSTAFTYDSRNRLTGAVNGLGTTVRAYSYYEDNSVYQIEGQDPGGTGLITVKEFEYSKRGELTRDEDALGYADLYTYDDEENVLTKTDKLGVVTDFEYWDTAWLKKTTLNVIEPTAMDIVTQYGYDENGNLETLTVYNPVTTDDDAVYTRIYDEADRLEKLINPNTAHYQVWTYNDHGEMASYQDANGMVTTNSYDALGRVTSRAYGSPYSVTVTQSYYGATGLLTMLSDGTRVVNTTYNMRLLPTQVQWVISSVVYKTIQYEYDNSRNTTSQSDPDTIYPIMYTYNDNNQLATITRNSTLYASLEYDSGGRVSELTYYTGYRNVWTYTTRSEIATLVLYDGATVPIAQVSRSYVYDPRGQVTSDTREDLFETVELEYDDAGRLIREQSTGNTQAGPLTIPQRDSHWTYDKAGNRLTQTRTTTPYGGWDETLEYTYSSENSLLTEDGYVTMPDSSDPDDDPDTAVFDIDHAYDNNGNRTSTTGGENITYTYDHLNRLAAYLIDSAGPDQTVTQAYMPNGKLISRLQVELGTTRWYAYDKMGILRTYDQAGTGTLNARALYINRPASDCTTVTRIGLASGVDTVNYMQDRSCTVLAQHSTTVNRRSLTAMGEVPSTQQSEDDDNPDKGEYWAPWCGISRRFRWNPDGSGMDFINDKDLQGRNPHSRLSPQDPVPPKPPEFKEEDAWEEVKKKAKEIEKREKERMREILNGLVDPFDKASAYDEYSLTWESWIKEMLAAAAKGYWNTGKLGDVGNFDDEIEASKEEEHRDPLGAPPYKPPDTKKKKDGIDFGPGLDSMTLGYTTHIDGRKLKIELELYMNLTKLTGDRPLDLDTVGFLWNTLGESWNNVEDHWRDYGGIGLKGELSLADRTSIGAKASLRNEPDSHGSEFSGEIEIRHKF